jgi:hypothetical protein
LRPLDADLLEMGDDEIHQPLRLAARDRRENNEAWMEIDAAGKFAKVVRILSHKNSVLRDGSGKDNMIGLA